jgi:Cyclin, C-terminal domain
MKRSYLSPNHGHSQDLPCKSSRCLAWKVHPPTAFCFGKHLFYLLPYGLMSVNVRHATMELARFLTELSVIDYYFVIHKPSVVAFAALLNAMEEIPAARSSVPSFCSEILKTTSIKPASDDVLECRNRLRLLYIQGGYSTPAESAEARDESVSPVCVTYGCTPRSYQEPIKKNGF